MNKSNPSPQGSLLLLILLAMALAAGPARSAANTAPDGTGAGPNVTVTDNGDDTVTMANGIAAIVIVKKTGRLNSVAYTYSHDETTKTCETLSAPSLLQSLAVEQRAGRLNAGRTFWIAAERLSMARSVYPDGQMEPALNPPPGEPKRTWEHSEAVR